MLRVFLLNKVFYFVAIRDVLLATEKGANLSYFTRRTKGVRDHSLWGAGETGGGSGIGGEGLVWKGSDFDGRRISYIIDSAPSKLSAAASNSYSSGLP